MNKNGLTKLREIGADAIIGAYQAYFGRCFSAQLTSETIEFYDCDYFVDREFTDSHWTVKCYVDTDWRLKVSYNDRIFTEANDIEKLRQFATAVQGFIDNHRKRTADDARKQAKEAQEAETQEENTGDE